MKEKIMKKESPALQALRAKVRAARAVSGASNVTLQSMVDDVAAAAAPIIEAGASPAIAVEAASESVRKASGISSDDWMSTVISQRVYPMFGQKFTALTKSNWDEITQHQSLS